MLTIGESVRVIARGNALPTSAVGKVVEITEVDTGGDEPVYGFRYACRMCWGKAGQFERATIPPCDADPIHARLPLSG